MWVGPGHTRMRDDGRAGPVLPRTRSSVSVFPGNSVAHFFARRALLGVLRSKSPSRRWVLSPSPRIRIRSGGVSVLPGEGGPRHAQLPRPQVASKSSTLHRTLNPATLRGMKVCSYCEQELPDALFHKRARSRDGLASECKDCRSLKAARRYREDPEFREARLQDSRARVASGQHKIENRKWWNSRTKRSSS